MLSGGQTFCKKKQAHISESASLPTISRHNVGGITAAHCIVGQIRPKVLDEEVWKSHIEFLRQYPANSSFCVVILSYQTKKDLTPFFKAYHEELSKVCHIVKWDVKTEHQSIEGYAPGWVSDKLVDTNGYGNGMRHQVLKWDQCLETVGVYEKSEKKKADVVTKLRIDLFFHSGSVRSPIRAAHLLLENVIFGRIEVTDECAFWGKIRECFLKNHPHNLLIRNRLVHFFAENICKIFPWDWETKMSSWC